MRNVCREDGVALVVSLMALLLLTAFGVVLTLATSLETMMAGNVRESQEAFYAADAGVEVAMGGLSAAGDWNAVLDGSVQSSFIDGVPTGARTLPDGSTIDLAQVASRANCRRVTTCSAGEMDMVTAERPWGANNPRWQLYAYGNLRDLVPSGGIDSPYYVIVMVADDPSELDNDPMRDSADLSNPGSGVLALRAEAFGPRGTRQTITATVGRGIVAGVRVLSWHHVRE
ncbi:MAG: pilus assembly PilX N-terminal domain-containing protein [Vicinamibacterales bacterium]